MEKDHEIISAGQEFAQFNELYNRHHLKFVRFAQTYTHDFEVARDFVSESFMVYWENREKLTPGSSPQAYILTVLKNKCLNYLRQTDYRRRTIQSISEVSEWKKQVSINSLEACNPEEIFSTEIKEMVEKALKKLPEKTLKAFSLSRQSDKTNKEIAEIMGISVKGVEFHISKALGVMRGELKDYLSCMLYFIFFM